MAEPVEITPLSEDLVVALENVYNITKFAVGLGQTTYYYNPEELQSISGTSFIWGDPEQTQLLSKRCEVYVAVAKKVLRSCIIEKKGTEEWPVTSEFEGIADDACIEFCNTRGLISDLRKCLSEAKIIFSNIENLSADLDYFEDEGNEDSGHVVIRLEVRTDQNTVLDEYDRWVDWFIAKVSPTNRTFFTLTVSRI